MTFGRLGRLARLSQGFGTRRSGAGGPLLPTLTLGGPLTFAADAVAGTLVATIGNVPAGATPTLGVNDNRLVIAGDAQNGWTVVKGLTASSAGNIDLSVSAAGANPASATVLVTAAGAGTAMAAPAAIFNVAPINTVQPKRSSNGAITHDYSHSSIRAGLTPLVTYWVDVATGNNANPGTQASPFRSGAKALAMAAASGGLACIKVKGSQPGQPRVKYLSTNTQTDGTTVYADSFNGTYSDIEVIIEPWNIGEIWDSVIPQATVSWASTADANIFKNSAPQPIACDYANLDDYGTPRRLARLDLAAGTSEADAITAINSFWTLHSAITDESGTGYGLGVICRVASGSTYVRTHNNRAPDANFQLVSDSGANLTINASAKAPRLFQTGAGYVGGSNQGCIRVVGTAGFRPVVNQSNCRFVCGGTGGSGIGSFSALGTSDSQGCDVISHRCSNVGASLDGYNYHNLCRFVELDCAGDWAGWSTGLTNNCTTAHEVCVGMRINGRYLNGQDRAVHDVGDSKVWMPGGIVSARRGADGTPQSTPIASGIEGTAGSSAIYLDSVVIRAGINGAAQYLTEVNYVDARIYYTYVDFMPVLGPAAVPGQVLAYTIGTGTFRGPYANLNGMGNSITAGSAASAADKRWLNLVAAAVGAGTPINSGSGGSIMQNSPNGHTPPDSVTNPDGSQLNNMRDRFESNMFGSTKAEAMTIAAGRNDAFSTGVGSITPAAFLTNYREVMNIALIGGYQKEKICLVEPYYQSDQMLNQGAGGASGLGRPSRAQYELYVSHVQRVATEYGANLAPTYYGLRDNGYAATNNGDFTHPADAGMAMISDVVVTKSYRPNMRPQPSGVNLSVSGTSITATVAGAVSGAVSYDFRLLKKFNTAPVADRNSQTLTTTFTGISDLAGYRVLARAVFANGSKGPWTVSARAVMPVLGSPFLFDDFTDPDGTSVKSRAAAIGGNWLNQTGTGSSTPLISGQRAYTNAGGTHQLLNTAVPPSADYRVDGLISLINTTGEFMAVAGRCSDSANTLIWWQWSKSDNGFRLKRKLNGAASENLSAIIPGVIGAGDRVLSLEMIGNRVAGLVDGVELASATENDITAAGRAGFYGNGVQTPTTGVQLDTILARPIA